MADYDRNPAPYLRQSVADNPYRLLEWTEFLEVLGPVRAKRVLDLACGNGRLTRVLAHGGAAEVLGLDVSAEMLERARERNAEGQSEAFPDRVTYAEVDAADETFQMTHLRTSSRRCIFFTTREALNSSTRWPPLSGATWRRVADL